MATLHFDFIDCVGRRPDRWAEQPTPDTKPKLDTGLAIKCGEGREEGVMWCGVEPGGLVERL